VSLRVSKICSRVTVGYLIKLCVGRLGFIEAVCPFPVMGIVHEHDA
jgi:hypothetical protein